MKLACLSDAHWLAHNIKDFPKADVCIYAGDWSGRGAPQEGHKFRKWLKGLPYNYKLVVPGNHDRWVQNFPDLEKSAFADIGANLLIDEAYTINGVKFYGSPWTPLFMNWAYMKDDDELDAIFAKIPEDTDVLITHGQPYDICDPVGYGSHTLVKHLDRVKPKVHIFGHAHEGYGYQKYNETDCYNVAVCSPAEAEYNYTYKVINPITVVEI